MIINLKYPYNEHWRKGYTVTNPEGRKTLILFNKRNERTSTQYARYLMAVKLGRYLTPEETVDHIDGNKQNDSIDNLQILTLKDNIRKTCKKEDYHCVCPICGKHFVIPRHKGSGILQKTKILNGTKCCSRECGYKLTAQKLKKK